MSLKTYKFRALTAAGRSATGEIRASDERDAFRRVASRGLTPVKLWERAAAKPMFSWQKVGREDVAALTRELAVLVEAKIPLDRGLISIAEHEGNAALSHLVRDLAAAIEGGQAFTEALGRHRAVFGELYLETVRVGERSGNLAAAMSHLSELMERERETSRQVKRALAYPITVLLAVTAAVGVIVVFVVPKFAATFRASGAQMPVATRVVQAVGVWFQQNWVWCAVAAGAAVMTVSAMWARASGRRLIERVMFRVPFVGKMLGAVTAARFAHVLAIGLTSGMDLTDAVSIAGRSTGRAVFADECETMAESLRRGDAFIDVLRRSRFMPSFARRMLGAGTDSAEIARTCDIVARHYDREGSHLAKNVSTVVEPLMTVALAGIVLLIALAVFLPMWKMSSLRH